MNKSLVLYADDDADDRFLVTEAFSAHKEYIDLQVFSDGIDLLRYLKTKQPKPCLIILDINMPKISGKDTLRILRTYKEFENTPVVLFTTSSQPEDSFFAQHFKAGFVTKPLNYHQMDIIIERFLDHCTEEDKQRFKGLKR
jgi:CheY-like chemotaxis protein